MSDDETLIIEDLYLALTRPVMMAGVPIEAAVAIAFAATVVLLATSNPLAAIAVGSLAVAAARLVVRKDHNMFRILSVWGKSMGAIRNKDYWGGASWASLPLKGLRRQGGCLD